MFTICYGCINVSSIIMQRLPNMFTILDDESKSPQTTDSSLVRNWSNNLSDAQNFKSVSGDELAFVITHFADEVERTIQCLKDYV